MKNFFLVTLIICSSFLPFIAFAQANFVRDLFLGLSGEDVFSLQKILNADPETRLADSGPGSSGNETNFFGMMTENAVKKLQNKYSEVILTPLGLNLPTGYVGQKTRDFLNEKNFSTTNPEQSEQNGQSRAISPVSKTPVISSILPEKFSGPAKLTIRGQNFTQNNSVLFTFEPLDTYQNIKSTENGTKIELDFNSSIQKVFDEKYSDISAKTKSTVLGQFPETELRVMVRNENGSSNIMTVKFNLK